jgi:hypothetical protein
MDVTSLPHQHLLLRIIPLLIVTIFPLLLVTIFPLYQAAIVPLHRVAICSLPLLRVAFPLYRAILLPSASKRRGENHKQLVGWAMPTFNFVLILKRESWVMPTFPGTFSLIAVAIKVRTFFIS